MFPDPATRAARSRRTDLIRILDALARETHEAFEALARRRYDAPWQRIALPRTTPCAHSD